MANLKGLHLGSGILMIRDSHIDWTNIDIQEKFKPDIVMDARCIDTSFEPNSIDVIWTCHMLEHLEYPNQAVALLTSCYKVMKPEGIIRIAVPDLFKIASQYVIGSADLKDIYGDCKAYYLFDTLGERFNYFMKEWEHKIVYDFMMLKKLLEFIGFKDIEQCEFRQSDIPAWSHDRLEKESIYVEARK